MAKSAGEDLTGLEQDVVSKRRALRELTIFFALAFTITFGLGAAIILARPQFEAVFGPLGPLLTSWPYYVAVSSPTISAVLLSAAFGGLKGVKTLFRGLIRPFQLRWLFVALLTYPAAVLLWGLAEHLLGIRGAGAINIHGILVSAPLILFTTPNIFTDPGPWGEETGWRGFALPRLLTRLSPPTAAIVLGVIWGVWHAPAFFAAGLTQAQYNFGWFLLAVVGISVLMAWIYVNANRNYVVAGVIPHAVNNLIGSSHVFADAAKTQAFVMTAIAAAIIVLSGPGLRGWRFSRRRGASAP